MRSMHTGDGPSRISREPDVELRHEDGQMVGKMLVTLAVVLVVVGVRVALPREPVRG